MAMCVFCAVEPRTSPHSWEGSTWRQISLSPRKRAFTSLGLFLLDAADPHPLCSRWGSGPRLWETCLVEPSLEMFHLQFPYRWLSRRAEEGYGRWIRFLVSSLGSQTELRWRGGERDCNQFCSLCSLPSGHFSKTWWRGLRRRCWAERPSWWLTCWFVNLLIHFFFWFSVIFSFWRKISWMLALFALFTS